MNEKRKLNSVKSFELAKKMSIFDLNVWGKSGQFWQKLDKF